MVIPTTLLSDGLPVSHDVQIFLAGISVGIMVGSMWEHAYELIRSGMSEINTGREHMNFFRRIGSWLRDTLGAVGFLLALNAVVWILIGVFLISANSRLTNFVKCQSDYNQKSSMARGARVGAAAAQDKALYTWIQSVQGLIGKDGTPPSKAEIHEFKVSLAQALATYNHNVQVQASNRYPADPVDTCGSY